MNLSQLFLASILILFVLHAQIAHISAACYDQLVWVTNCYYGDNTYKWCFGEVSVYDEVGAVNPATGHWQVLSYNDPNPQLSPNGYTTVTYKSNWDYDNTNHIWRRKFEVGRKNDPYNLPLKFISQYLCEGSDVQEVISRPDPVSFTFCLWYVFCPTGY